jgi:hypothetical protein
MRRCVPQTLPHRQRGVVLIVALVLLVAITLLSLAGISTTTLELIMATNQQARVTAFQQAEAGIDAATASLENFPVSGLVGAERCTPDFNDDDVDCGATNITLPDGFDLTYSRIRIARLPPLLQPAPRYIETSAEKLKVANFLTDSRYDAREIRGSRAEHNQGLFVTVLTPSEETVIRGDDIDIDEN